MRRVLIDQNLARRMTSGSTEDSSAYRLGTVYPLLASTHPSDLPLLTPWDPRFSPPYAHSIDFLCKKRRPCFPLLIEYSHSLSLSVFPRSFGAFAFHDCIQRPAMEPNLNANNKRTVADGEDYHDDNNNKKTRSNRVDLRFLLASRDAGAIIGRQGKNIQMLRTKYKSIVQVPDQDGPERILTIAGELDPCLDCLTDALATMADNQKLRQDISELRALVHTSQAGAVIGKGGERVKELRIRYGLEVKVFSDTCPNSTDRVILCRGEQRAILDCLREIFIQIDKIPPRGPSHAYDPSCYSEHQIQNYGGFAHDETSVYGDRRGRGPGGAGGGGSETFNNFESWEANNMRGGPGGSGGVGGGMYNDNYGGPPNQGFYPPPPPPPQMMGSGGGQGPIRPMMTPFEQSPDTETQQVTIPQELAGAIIGPRGTRISQIRQQSGASIKIDDPLPGTNDRVITIVGARSQISQAQYLLQSAVRQSGLYPG